jgi:DNA-binding CsgD family transcriptional regulator
MRRQSLPGGSTGTLERIGDDQYVLNTDKSAIGGAVGLPELNREFDKLLSGQVFDEDDLDPAIVARHLALLRELEASSTGAMSVFDLLHRRHVYLGEGFIKVFGWDLDAARSEPRYGDRRIHPEDMLLLMEAGIHFTRLALSFEPERRRDLKFYADYRTRGPCGDYMRVVEQQSVLENDPAGNVWLALSVLDLSPDPDPERGFLCRLLNSRSGELFLFPPRVESGVDLLTVREKEILALVSKGLVSHQIADLLYISVNTVNTHRQRIIRKLDVSNTSEAIRYAMDLGLLKDA